MKLANAVVQPNVVRFSPQLFITTRTSARTPEAPSRFFCALPFQVESPTRRQKSREGVTTDWRGSNGFHCPHKRVPHRAAARGGYIRLRAVVVVVGELSRRQVLEREEGEMAEVGGVEGEVRGGWPVRREARVGERRGGGGVGRGGGPPAPTVRPQPRRRASRLRLRGLQQPTSEPFVTYSSSSLNCTNHEVLANGS